MGFEQKFSFSLSKMLILACKGEGKRIVKSMFYGFVFHMEAAKSNKMAMKHEKALQIVFCLQRFCQWGRKWVF